MSRLPTGWTLGTAWAAYIGLLAFVYPLTPLAVLAMAVPLALTGWFAPRFVITALVGLVHGVALGGIGWTVGAFSGWPGAESLPFAVALTTLLSWAFALAGWTMRVMHLLRLRTDDLEAARRQIDADAATVEAVYTASAAALIAVDKDRRIVSWNPGAQAIFGHPASKAIGAQISMLSALGHADDCIGRIEYVLDTGRQMATFSGKLRHDDGRVLDVEVRPRILGRDGRVLLTVVDRTREVVLSDEVARQAQQQDRIIHNLDEVLYSVAVPSMNVLMMSRSVAQLTGRDAEDLANFRDVLALAHPDDKEEVLRRWEHARSGEKSVLRWRMRTALGQHVWVEDRVVPARDDEGRVVRVDGSIRRIFRELELERQAQRMMRWLDAMEPMTGGGAWSVDLRTGAWQWSNGMRRILAIEEEPEDGWDAWNARLDPASAQALSSLVADPANPHPLIIHVAVEGQWQPLLLEPWVQRGADGEPIWLYGIVRPRASKRRRRARLRNAAPEQAATQAAHAGQSPLAGSSDDPAADAGGAMAPPAGGQRVLSVVAAQAKHVPPDSPEAGRFIGMALARARMAAAQGMEVDVLHAISDATAVAVEHAIAWARAPRVPVATGLSADDAPLHVARLAQAAQRQAIDAVLASEDAAARERLAQADARVARIEQEARQRIETVRQQAMQQAEAASEAARREAARAQAAQQARLETERQAQQAAQDAKQMAAAAIREAERSRAEALQAAQAAKDAAQREAARAEKAEKERDRAEEARQRALQEAESTKRAAVEEAERLRNQAIAVADEARRLAEQETEKARQATAAMQAAQKAREEAVQAAEQAKAHALNEAGKTRHAALQAAQEAQRRADAEAEKAQRAEEARRLAETARQKAADAAEAAKAKALEDAEAVRREALEAAAEAKRRAEDEARHAQQAAKALREAEQARAEALRAAQEATRRAADEEAARKAAMEEAKRATDAAMQKAQDALAAAQAEAQRAQAAEEARVQAEEAMARAVADAQAAAEAAREEAARVQAEAREEARRATAAARAEAAKAEQAEKALAAALAEAQRSRDQAIRQAEQAREEAVRQAEQAREEAVRQAQHAREEALQELAEAKLRADEAEARAEQAWEHARSRAVAVEQTEAEAAGPPAPERGQAPSAPWVPEPEEPPADMDVVWDDEIGWIPRPRGGPRKDSAEQLKAKAWQSEGKPKKGAGPWALD